MEKVQIVRWNEERRNFCQIFGQFWAPNFTFLENLLHQHFESFSTSLAQEGFALEWTLSCAFRWPTFCKFSHIFYTMRHFNLRRFNHSISQIGHLHHYQLHHDFYFCQFSFHLVIWIFFIIININSISQFGFLFLPIMVPSRNLDFLSFTRLGSISQFGFSHIVIWISSSRNLDISEKRVISHHLVISPSRNLDIPKKI